MKRTIYIAGLILGLGWQLHAQELATKADSLSYAMGMLLAQGVQKQEVPDLNIDVFLEATKKALSKEETVLNLSQANMLFQEYATEKANRDKLEAEKYAAINKEKGFEFLSENAERMEVTTLPSGLQYEVLQEGEGASPGVNDQVVCHYTGTLIDGTVFDSSVERGEPITFGLNRVIEAWQEALPLMKIGSKWKIYAPYQLAYGERGAGKLIKPYSTLIFEIELIDIIPGD